MFGLWNKYKNMSIPSKAAVWYIVCNILQKGISFFTVPVYVRMLTTTEYGQYTVFQSWKEILAILATLNLYCGVFTKAMVDYEDDRDRYTSSMQGLSTIITTVFLLIYFIGNNIWNFLFSTDTPTMLLMIAYFYTFPAFQFWSVRQRVEYKYKRMVAVTLLSAVSVPLVGITLLFCTGLREKAVIYGYLFSQIVIGLFFYILNFRNGKTFFHAVYWKHAVQFNIPLIPHYLSLIVLGQSDRIMIEKICGADKAGIYTLAYQVSMVMSLFTAAINNSFVPWMYGNLKNERFDRIRKLTKSLCICIWMASIGVMLIAPEIIGVLGTDEYYQAIWIVPAVAGSTYFTYCYGLFANVEFYYNATKYVMIATTTGAVLNIVLNALFIPIFGFIAGGYTTLICYNVFMVMHYKFMRKVCIRKGVSGDIFDVKFIFASSAIMYIGLGICTLLYNTDIIRYCVILGLLIIVWIKKEKIREVLKTFR